MLEELSSELSSSTNEEVSIGFDDVSDSGCSDTGLAGGMYSKGGVDGVDGVDSADSVNSVDSKGKGNSKGNGSGSGSGNGSGSGKLGKNRVDSDDQGSDGLNRSFVCAYAGCLKSYSKPSLLELHENTHTGVRPFKCSRCNKAYYKKSHLHIHEVAIHTAKKYKCELCGRELATRDSLKKHSDVCGRVFVCHFCHKRFVRAEWYIRHIRQHTDPNSVSKTAKSSQCKKLSSNNVREVSMGVRNGSIDMGEVSKGEVGIDEVSKGEVSKDKIDNGEDKIKTAKIYKPTQLKPTQPKLTQSKLTQLKPTQPKPTKTEELDSTNTTATNHITTPNPILTLNHTNASPPTSSIQPPYNQCSTCGKYFKLKKNLRAHEEGAHGRNKYTCPVCHNKFSYPATLRRHIQNLHKDYCPGNKKD
ncbi:KRAB domain-containing zinc finger protein [Nematocida homosporus]|uniref:KRAB domain-containing zinc finger protein n=1 Tax=Nematocida homosporus TaxID=1912981 RepID=UPI00221F29B2|nr:KRAB domain-containing zinc finger protein [Nematocida homosporus]KAI5187008.1 KRAB domain-containing zinc finger protein [Nematocida homosporus]